MSHPNIYSEDKWLPYSCDITPEMKAVFDKVVSQLDGVNYQAVAVANYQSPTEPVMRLSFFCNTQEVFPGARVTPAILCIESVLGSEPALVGQEPLKYWVENVRVG